MVEQVYICVDESLGAPFLTTLEVFKAQLFSFYKDQGWGPPPTLYERRWAHGEPPVVVDVDEEVVLIPATLENLLEYRGVEDPGGFFWQALCLEGWQVLEGLLDKRVSFAQAKQALRQFKSLIKGVR